MKLKIRVVLLILFTTTCLQAVLAQAVSFEEKANKLFAKNDKKNAPGFAVILIDGEKVMYKNAFGLANLEHNIPNTPKTIFNVASVSKQFTAFAIARLIEEGKISLDDDVRKFIPELSQYKKKLPSSIFFFTQAVCLIILN